MAENRPPVAKYRLTLEISGNTHAEIEQELLSYVNGGYLLDTDYHKRHSFKVIGGRRSSTLEHTNPGMTPDRYSEELTAWADARRSERED